MLEKILKQKKKAERRFWEILSLGVWETKNVLGRMKINTAIALFSLSF